jgi:hypothetical protein
MVYHITPYTYRKASELGVEVKPSTHAGKKIDVFRDGKKIASIGALGMMDYPTYLRVEGKDIAEHRRKLYHLRHHGEGIGGYYAKKLLW